MKTIRYFVLLGLVLFVTLVLTKSLLHKRVFTDLRTHNNKDLLSATQLGFPIDRFEENGYSPLIYASMSGNAEAVAILIEAGADVNTPTNDGFTALMGASDAGDVGVVRLLIKKGANVNASMEGGETALMWAVVANRKEAVRALIQSKADVYKKDNSGQNAFDLSEDNKEIYNLLPKQRNGVAK